MSSYPRWILFLAHSTIHEYLSEARIPFDCELLTVEQRDGYTELSLVYKVHEGGPLVVERLGRWLPNVGLEALDKTPLYEKRRDLEGLQLKVLAVNGVIKVVVWFYLFSKGNVRE